ncbi:FecR domain-containing protein [Spirochaetia bacterium 38H-sp]|uniref:FecR domain-containing protein n=1 Tax=Rarispira pelagica TaxID=3141764 RepID=A0ABU9U929_9SPIR
MRKMTIGFLTFFLLLSYAFSQEITVSYLEGWADKKEKNGGLVELFIGDVLMPGEGVVTSSDGFVELEMGNGTTIKIGPDSVFLVEDMPYGEEKQTGFAALMGEVSYKFGKFSGTEPMSRTQGAICGVRGTEFTIVSASDGSSLIHVLSGKVEVTAQGQSVALGPEEAVTVELGAPPSEKFSSHGKPLDFSAWNKERSAKMLKDPLSALESVMFQLESYADKADALKKEQNALKQIIDRKLEEFNRIEKEKGRDVAIEYRKKEIDPLTSQSAYLGFNYRYYALSALSLRRYMIVRLYIPLRAKVLTGDYDRWNEFYGAYMSVLEFFDKRLVPYLVQADI